MHRKTIYPMVFLLLLLFLIFIFSINQNICKAEPQTLEVGSGKTYITISDAITNANISGGDTVLVYSGTYNENIVIDRQLTLQSNSGSSSTIISGSSDHSLIIESDNTVIIGFTIQNTGGTHSCLYLREVESCEAKNNIIKNGGNGIYFFASNNNIIKDNTQIKDNNVGIYFSNSNNNIISNNYIQENDNNGVYLHTTSSGNTFYENHFLDNTPGENARDLASNIWSYNQKGNYWDDYTGKDTDENGIGDDPYEIDSDSIDNYPLGYFVNEKPQATIISINPNPATEGNTISFNGDSSDDGTIYEWQWTSNIDGEIATSEDFQSSSLSTGTHTIKFRVKDSQQWSEYDQETLVINEQQQSGDDTQQPEGKPSANIIKPESETTKYESSTVEFQGTGTPYQGTITQYSWRSNIDGSIGTSSSFSKSDLSVGIHTIYLKVKDSNSWSDEVSTSLIILADQDNNNNQNQATNNPPSADTGGPYTGLSGFTIVFDASKTTDDGEINTYKWDFGDGNTGSGYKLSHSYTNPGNYTVTLTVTDDSGKTDTKTTYAKITDEQTQNNDEENNNDTNSIPGFQTIILLLTIFLTSLILIYKKQ